MKKFTFLTSLIALLFLTSSLSAQTILFEEDFETDNTANWVSGEWTGSNTNEVNFYFDYSSVGLVAPEGKTGTFGMMMRANEGDASNTDATNIAHISAFPVGESFTGNYTVTFDMWMNYDGVGYAGSTELAKFGVFHTATEVPLTTGLDFGLTSDNGNSKDFRVYENGLLLPEDDTYYPLAPMNADEEAYTNDVFTTIGEDPLADAAMEWVTVKIIVSPTHVKLLINEVLFSEFDYAAVDGNIMFGYSDVNGGVGSTEGFIIYDNLSVFETDLTGISDYDLDMFSVYPNPASDILNVVVSKRSNFKLLNTVGQTVMSSMVEGKSTIQLGNLEKGIYFAKVTTEKGETQTRKVIIK